MRRDNLTHVVNASVNQTLGRTVITAGTALLSVIALFFFGGEVLQGFAFTMIVGIITGTYSSVFIAAAIVLHLAADAPRRRRRGARAAPSASPRRSSRAARSRAQRGAAASYPRARRMLTRRRVLGVVQGLTEFLRSRSRRTSHRRAPSSAGTTIRAASSTSRCTLGTLVAIVVSIARRSIAMVAGLPEALSATRVRGKIRAHRHRHDAGVVAGALLSRLREDCSADACW